MAMQAQIASDSHLIDLRQKERSGAARDLPHCEELMAVIQDHDEFAKQSASQDTLNCSASTSSSTQTQETFSCKEDAGESELHLQPPLKRLRCRSVLQLVNHDRSKLQRHIADVRQTGDSTIRKHDGNSVAISQSEDQNVVMHKAEWTDRPADELEAEEPECVTPKAGEQRIPDSQAMVCPPPPRKRKPAAFKSPSPFANSRASFLTNPPDLHTFPACIRALFDK
ncbi:hypothetical protein L7F22_025653 [Adiantum nelumboides]|nr:hypothetical protein [Adiantum nelumboides]